MVLTYLLLIKDDLMSKRGHLFYSYQLSKKDHPSFHSQPELEAKKDTLHN